MTANLSQLRERLFVAAYRQTLMAEIRKEQAERRTFLDWVESLDDGPPNAFQALDEAVTEGCSLALNCVMDNLTKPRAEVIDRMSHELMLTIQERFMVAS